MFFPNVPGATFLITEGNANFFSKYPLFDVVGDAYFEGHAY